MPKPTLPTRLTGRSPEAAAGRFALGLAARYAAIVALVLGVLLVPVYLGWIGATGFALAALVLASMATGFAMYPAARVLHNLREVLARFRDGEDPARQSPGGAGSWASLEAELAQLPDRTRQRVEDLKAACSAVERQHASQQRIADHLIQAQRIARLGSWDWKRITNRVACSAELYRLLQIDRDTRPTTAALLNMIHEDDRRAFRRWIVRLSKGTEPHGFDIRLRSRRGTILHLHVLGEALREGKRAVGFVGTLQDATERTHAIQQIHQLAYYDVLTELPNRSRFHEKLAETLEVSRRGGKSFALMFLDLDQFKRINDTFGHSVGDDLLRVVAQRLTRVIRAEDPVLPSRAKSVDRDVCRQGGDEFIVLLNGVATEEQAARAANRVIEALAQPITIGTQDVFVSASIGIVLFPRDGDGLDALLKNADVAMYHAKSEGRNRYAFYHDSMRQATAKKLSLERDLRRAIEGEQFELHYQPQIDVSTGRIVGLEALIRWNHPTLGKLWPKYFIAAAEEAGLIMAIWEWVFVAALIQHNAWQQEGLPPVTIGVNLSSVQFADDGLAARVKEIAGVVGVPLEHIELELTESALVADFDRALATLQALRGMGVKIAIDDFGTGYSSLSYLRKLPIDKLKLDHSFTADAVASHEGAAIARAIISMGQSLNLHLVAEGVETQQQIQVLMEMGCTTMQGYLLSRPLSVAAITDLLRRHFGTVPQEPAGLVDEPPEPQAQRAEVATLVPSSIDFH